MKITFLIGNGFDLNLGLDTTYDSFIREYAKSNDKDTEYIKAFKKNINQNLKLWSAAELAFGQITSCFPNTKEGAQNFSDCHIDFCEHLAGYLQTQEKRIKYENNKNYIKENFRKAISKYYYGLREEQKNIIFKIANSKKESYTYNFINFNYTTTLDNFISYINNPIAMGYTVRGEYKLSNRIDKVYHVHGTTSNDMVFGVNDASQITNLKLFDGQPSVFKDQVIKNLTNKMNEERIYEKVLEVLNDSNLIYIFGMSLGETDAFWWENINILLAQDTNLHVIVQAMDVPKNELIRVKFIQFENAMRDKFVNYSKLSDDIKNDIKLRIHVVGENIFNQFTQFVSKQDSLHHIQENDDENPDDKKSA